MRFFGEFAHVLNPHPHNGNVQQNEVSLGIDNQQTIFNPPGLAIVKISGVIDIPGFPDSSLPAKLNSSLAHGNLISKSTFLPKGVEMKLIPVSDEQSNKMSLDISANDLDVEVSAEENGKTHVLITFRDPTSSPAGDTSK